MRKDLINQLPQPIIVCGMHRSGTSLISRILNDLGVFMGNDTEVNNESLSFLLLNDKLLAHAHSFWDQIDGAFSFFINNEAIEQAVELVKKHYFDKSFFKSYLGKKTLLNDDSNWGWKDPRNTITFPIWTSVFENAKILFIYRNGIDSVASLVHREHKQNFDITIPAYSSRCLNLESAFSLWEDYNRFFLNHKNIIKKDNLLEIKYEDFLQQPEIILNQIADFTNVSVNQNIIDNICSKINKSRAYPFFDDQELVDFYDKVKNNEIMVKLEYQNLINE